MQVYPDYNHGWDQGYYPTNSLNGFMQGYYGTDGRPLSSLQRAVQAEGYYQSVPYGQQRQQRKKGGGLTLEEVQRRTITVEALKQRASSRRPPKNKPSPEHERKWPKSRRQYRRDHDNFGPNCWHKYRALDCEMIGVEGPNGETVSELARVTILEYNGHVMLDEMVAQRPGVKIVDYRTAISGITPALLQNAPSYDQVQARVSQLIEGRIVVGHDLQHDLRVLGITHPWHLLRDTACYPPFMKTRFPGDPYLWPKSLKELAARYLNQRQIQVAGRPHCPREDAKAALDLYKTVWRHWERSLQKQQGGY